MKNYIGLYYRLMERILLICVENRESKLSEEDSSKWTARFTAILDHVSSIVGHVIKLGQEIHTEDGRSYFATCTELVAEHINPNGNDWYNGNVGMRTLLYKKGIAKFCNAPTC